MRRIDAPRAPLFGFLTTPAGVRAVGDAIADERVDVAHCHVSIVSPAALGGAQAERRRFRRSSRFTRSSRRRICSRARRELARHCAWPARFSAVSERVARDVQPSRANEIAILANGIDVDAWRVQPAPRRIDRALVSVMRLNAKKRPLALVD